MLYLVVRQTMEKQEGIMGIISQWRTFAWEHPAKVRWTPLLRQHEG